jgi:hypothetical protein
MLKPTYADEYKLIGNFEAVRQTLSHDRFVDRLSRPLAFWVLPNDRRLPLAFLGRTLRDLLDTPFEELAATAGIGQKKIHTLIKLLHRATKDRLASGLDGAEKYARKESSGNKSSGRGFDPSIVSEALWEEWRQIVVRFGLGSEKLGRLAATLQSLPTVMWHTTLEAYCKRSLAEIRQLKTHGEKRIGTILEVFCSIHEMLANSKLKSHLRVRLLPKFVVPAENWIDRIGGGEGRVAHDAVCRSLIVPLLKQIQTDAGSTVRRLAEGRLGMNGDPQTVRQQSPRMGVTRARVYQLLEECAEVMGVRWPEGHAKLLALQSRLEASKNDGRTVELVRRAIDLFFPDLDELAARAARDGSED